MFQNRPYTSEKASMALKNCGDSRSLTGIVRLLFPCWRLITDNSSERLLLNGSIFESTITLSV